MTISVSLVGTIGRASAATCTTGGGTTSAGDTLAAFVTYDATAGAITTAGDNKGNTYTAAGTTQADGNGGLSRWYYCNAAPNVGAAHTFTFTTANSHFGTLHFFRISTTLSSVPFLSVTQAQDTATPWTITTASLNAGDLVLTGFANNAPGNGAWTTATGSIISTETDSGAYWASSVLSETMAGAGAYSPSLTNATKAGATGTALVAMVMREAGGGGGGGGGAVIINSFF